MNIPASVNNSYDLDLDELEADTIYTKNLYLNNVDIITLLNNTSTTTGMQNQINDLQANKSDKTYVDTQDYNLQTQITVNTNKNTEQDTRLNNIESKNTSQDNSITSLNNSISTINNSINSINSTNTTQNTRLSTIENSAIYTLNSGTIITNTLSAGSNSSVSLTITQPTSNPNNKNLNFTFNIPRGNTGATGETGATGISFIWKDTWTNPYSYYKNDVCYWDGSSYICLGNKDNRNNPVVRDVNPSDNPDEWVKMCAKGEQGPRGSTGSSGLDDFLSALGLAGLIGGSALAILAGVLSITDNATSLQNGINGLNNALNATNARVSTLEQKTQNQTATSGDTSFQGNIFMKNPLTQSTNIDLNGYNGKITAISSSINDGSFSNINSSNLSTGNLNASGSDINIGTSSISTVNINSLSTNINGFIYFNGVPHYPYIPTNVFQQFT